MRPELLRDQWLDRQYEASGNLAARIALHARFSTSKIDWMDWVFERLTLPARARVLEVGCGTLLLWRRNAARVPAGWALTLTDRSEGMLAEGRALLAEAAPALAARAAFGVADAARLPFAAGSFDAVIANHMLYHVPDRAQALREFKRVLAPGGRLFAATNGKAHMAEVRAPGITAILYPERALPWHEQVEEDWFGLEHGGAEVAAVFGNSSLAVFPDGLAVHDVGALLAYHESYVALDAAQRSAVLAYYDARRGPDGVVRIAKASGLFEARA